MELLHCVNAGVEDVVLFFSPFFLQRLAVRRGESGPISETFPLICFHSPTIKRSKLGC